MTFTIILNRLFIFCLLFLYSFACSYPIKNQNLAQVPKGFQGSYLVLKDGVVLDSKGLGLANNTSREKRFRHVVSCWFYFKTNNRYRNCKISRAGPVENWTKNF